MPDQPEHQHPDAPEQIVPHSLNDYLEVMTKAVFQSGMSWKVANSKWTGFQAGFQGFDVAKVAAMDESAIDDLAADTRIIRNRRKIVATVHNAQRLINLDEEYGGIRNYFRAHGISTTCSRTFANSSNTWETPEPTIGCTYSAKRFLTTRSSVPVANESLLIVDRVSRYHSATGHTGGTTYEHTGNLPTCSERMGHHSPGSGQRRSNSHDPQRRDP